MSFEETLREAIRRELAPLLAKLDGLAATGGADEWLTIEEAATLAKTSAVTIRSWLRRGVLKRRGVGRVRRVSRAELLALAEPETPPEAPPDPEAAAVLYLAARRGE